MKQQILSRAYQHPLLVGQDLEKVISAHQKVCIAKGDYFLQYHQTSNSYLILESGLMRAFVHDYEGNDITTDFFSPTDVVIEVLSHFQRTPSLENIQALTDCVGWEIQFDIFQELYHSSPGFSEWGRLWMTGKLFQQKQRALEMITTSAKDRYEKLIKEKPEIVLHSPLKYIASYLGITDTSFSRIRKEV